MPSKQAKKKLHRNKKAKKYKLLLDEGLPPSISYPNLNSYHDLVHIGHDDKLGGAKDFVVYQKAIKQGRIMMIFNIKDFKPLLKSRTPSIIALSQNMTNKNADLKLCSTLRKLKPFEKYGHYISVSNQGVR